MIEIIWAFSVLFYIPCITILLYGIFIKQKLYSRTLIFFGIISLLGVIFEDPTSASKWHFVVINLIHAINICTGVAALFIGFAVRNAGFKEYLIEFFEDTAELIKFHSKILDKNS